MTSELLMTPRAEVTTKCAKAYAQASKNDKILVLGDRGDRLVARDNDPDG